MNLQNSKSQRLFIGIILFLSNFTFLVYEVCWNRMLSLVLGATVTASTIVLMAFMSGMGAGAFFWGRKISAGKQSAGRVFAFLLTGISLFNIFTYYIFTKLPNLYSFFSRQQMSEIIMESTVYSISFILIFISTFFIGGVLPVAGELFMTKDKRLDSDFGFLYALDTLGSSLGGLTAGFFFLGYAGQQTTIVAASIINLSCALLVFLKSSKLSRYMVNNTIARQESVSKKDNQLKKIALIAISISGFTGLAYQLLWLRAFKIYLVNTSYTFALIASLMIFGLFIGSFIFEKLAKKVKDYVRFMMKLQFLLALWAGLGTVLLVKAPVLFIIPLNKVISIPVFHILLPALVLSVVVVIPVAILLGITFPLACRIYTGEKDDVGQSIGMVLMSNTIGSFLGPAVATFILIPYLGVSKSILFVLLLNSGLSFYLYCFKRDRGLKSSLFKYAIPLVSLLVLGVLIGVKDIMILPPSFGFGDKDVLFYHETVEGTLTVGKNKAGVNSTYVNNSAVIGSSYDAIKAVKMLGNLPFLIGRNPEEVLIVGFGIGVTTSTLAQHQEVKKIDCIELVSDLKDAAKHYNKFNKNITEDPRLHIKQGDGRHYLQTTANKYDLISSDPTHPVLGSANLYSQEYFQLCRDHLTSDGMVTQYLPLHKLQWNDFFGIIKTFHSVFPDATVWLGHSHAILLGTTKPLRIDFAQWSQSAAKIKDPMFYADPYYLAVNLIFDSETIKALSADIDIVTDNKSYLEFFDYKGFYPKNMWQNIAMIKKKRTKADAFFTIFENVPDKEKMYRYYNGNNLFLTSLKEYEKGEKRKSLQTLRRANMINSENQEFRFLGKYYYNVNL